MSRHHAFTLILVSLVAALLSPVASAEADAPVSERSAVRSKACVTASQDPCRTAAQYRRAFKRGDLGRTTNTKSKFSAAFKTKLRNAATRKGLIPPASARLTTAQRASYKWDGWGDYWNAFNNAVDCVAPGAESSCREDFDEIKPLKKPAKIVIGCGGLAIAAFYTGGTAVPATAALGGGLICGWEFAIQSW